MYCPDYSIFRSRLICLTMYSDRDVPRKFVPKTQWMNPFRYQITILPKGYNQDAKMVVINPKGRAWIKVSNLIFKLKLKLGLR